MLIDGIKCTRQQVFFIHHTNTKTKEDKEEEEWKEVQERIQKQSDHQEPELDKTQRLRLSNWQQESKSDTSLKGAKEKCEHMFTYN